jgi:hypothetical protein
MASQASSISTTSLISQSRLVTPAAIAGVVFRVSIPTIDLYGLRQAHRTAWNVSAMAAAMMMQPKMMLNGVLMAPNTRSYTKAASPYFR